MSLSLTNPNGLMIDGTPYINNVVDAKTTTLNSQINQVNTNLNNVSSQPNTLYCPGASSTNGVLFYPATFPAPWAYDTGICNTPSIVQGSFLNFSSDVATLNQNSLSLSSYDTFSGFDTSSNHVFLARDTIHFTSTIQISSPSYYASYLQPDVFNGVYGYHSHLPSAHQLILKVSICIFLLLILHRGYSFLYQMMVQRGHLQLHHNIQVMETKSTLGTSVLILQVKQLFGDLSLQVQAILHLT